jgi:hypothetical protein
MAVAMDRHPSISEDGLIGDLHTAALTLSTVQDQTGGNEDGLFVRDVWGDFSRGSRC